MSKLDFATRGQPRRHASELAQGYVLCTVMAALDDTGVLTKLEEDGLQIGDVDGNAQLSRDTLYYMVDPTAAVSTWSGPRTQHAGKPNAAVMTSASTPPRPRG